jgi:creatinine amidohydrolase
VVVLPTVPFGVNTGQLDIPLCINMNPSTQLAVLRDVVHALESASVRKLVILNGHGANNFRQMIRELQPETDLFLCAVDWYKVVDPRPYFDDVGDHAGEIETSVMQQIAPEVVLPLSDAGTGRERASRIAAIREGWAWAPRQWTRVTDDTGIGNPAAATPAKGARYLQEVVERVAGFLVELAAMDPASPYLDTP